MDIREGLLSKIKSIHAWRNSDEDPMTAEDDTDDILRWLHSQGVVKKVNRELFDWDVVCPDCKKKFMGVPASAMAGYEIVESLIK